MSQGLLAAGFVSAILGLLQYYGLAHWLSPWTTSPGLGQAYGNLRQRNQFASLISMALISLLWLYAASLGRRTAVTAWAYGSAAVLLTLAAAASTSRTGLLEWSCISAVSAHIAWRQRRDLTCGGQNARRLPHPLLLLALIPAYFLAAWALPFAAGSGVEGMLVRLQDGAPSGHSRVILWHNVLDLIAVHPWVGWGWGELAFAHFDTVYASPRFVEILDNAHNLPLHLAVELGIPAALLICGGFAWLVLSAKPWAEGDADRVAVWGILGTIVLHSLLEYPLWYGPFQLVFGLCLGFLWPHQRAPAASHADSRGPLGAFSMAAAAALMAIVVYTGWDYTRISQIYLEPEDRLAAYRDDAIGKAGHSWLFANHVRFAELTLTPVTRANAAEVQAMASQLIHFSPEPRVITKLIESDELLGRDDEARALAKRFALAFPDDYALWLDGPDTQRPAPLASQERDNAHPE